ncbi:MAG: FitA-like ribbon-helix-helix domain-containing protein [Bryobacteraceae bacterium]
MTLTIDLPDEEIEALRAKARDQGISAEQYARRVLEHDLESSPAPRHIWEVIAENMKQVPPEDLALLPRDGASQIDHYIYGVPKRDV